jgi:hypothetical protein
VCKTSLDGVLLKMSYSFDCNDLILRDEKDNLHDDVGIPLCMFVANGNGETLSEQKQGGQSKRPGEGNRYVQDSCVRLERQLSADLGHRV